jgi:hypothetical protein
MKEAFDAKLLVEGADDQHVIWALCEKHALPKTFDVIDCKGIESLKEQLPVRLNKTQNNPIGVIIDADTDLQARWNSIKAILTSSGFVLPVEFPENGLVVTNSSGNKTVGVWLMPDNRLNGMLEDFVSFLIPVGDQLLPVAHATIDGIEREGLNKYSEIHKSKALVHTWLAWQADPGTPMGLSITKRYLDTTGAVCTKFIAWLSLLFS